jgi:hypothetical protein
MKLFCFLNAIILTANYSFLTKQKIVSKVLLSEPGFLEFGDAFPQIVGIVV